MPLKNYTTKVSTTQTAGEIQELLASHGAKKIMMDYSDSGIVESVTFGLMLNGIMAGFRISAKPNGVIAAMKKDGVRCDAAQANRIAWRNVKDWIAAQIAMVETEQATMDEMFLPYLLDGERTIFQKFQESGVLPALPSTGEKGS